MTIKRQNIVHNEVRFSDLEILRVEAKAETPQNLRAGGHVVSEANGDEVFGVNGTFFSFSFFEKIKAKNLNLTMLYSLTRLFPLATEKELRAEKVWL